MRFLLYTTGGEAQPSAPPSKQMMDELAKLTDSRWRHTTDLHPPRLRLRDGHAADGPGWFEPVEP